MPANPKGAIQLLLQAAATPERVLEAATLFNQLLKDAYPELSEDSVTMVVQNFDMTAGIRWQDNAGKRAVDGIIRFLLDPDTEASKHPDVAWAIARALSDNAEMLTAHKAELRTPKRKLAEISELFVANMTRLARDPSPRPALRGTMVVYTKIYKVGQTSDRARQTTARIDVDGRTHEVVIRSTAANEFFDAAKSKKIHAVYIDANWIRTADGKLVFDPRRSRLTKVEKWHPISGADLMQRVEQLPTESLLDIDDLLDDLEAI